MRSILNILIAFLVMAIVFNYQFYYIRRTLNGFNDELDALKDFSNIYDVQEISEYYFKLEDEEYNIEKYYIEYDDYIPDADDIVDEKIAIMNFESSEMNSLSEIKCEEIRTTDYYLLEDNTIVTNNKALKKNLKNKIKNEFYIVESNKNLLVIAGELGLDSSKLETGRFTVKGTKQPLDEDIFIKIKKDNKKLYSNDYMWIKNVYILLEKSN